MLDDIKPVSGRKGGGKGGGSSRTPYEAPDNLLTDSTAYLIDVVSEGEIEGWGDADNPGTCIYFDDTPLQNADGSFNFEGVEYWLRTGTPDQEPVPGFSAVENEVGVSVQVEAAQPVVRSVTASDVDAVRIKVGVASLSTLNTENGDLTEAAVDFAIDIQAGAGGWQTVGTHSINGKTTSGYQRAYRVELPEVRPVSIRVRRITPDSDSSNIQDDLYFVSYTEIIDAKLRYPDTAYVALAVPASAFGGRVPRRSYRLKGVKCWVPSNYDPETRTYDESTIWDGTFKRAFTSNPAFLTYTVLIENRWGLGERIAPELVDKWRIYQIGKYCDELVPNGLGGMEPRFTMNGVMNTREAAYQVITQLSAAFRGVTYWGAGAVVPVQDAPADPVKIVTNANVVDGAFNYAGTSLSARKTAVVASYRHSDDHFKVKAGLVFEDHDAMQRYGRRQVDTTLPFTTSRGEALRTAKWIVDTNLTSQETVNYQAGFDHAAIRPGDKLLISDKHRIGFRVGGRIVAVAADRLSVTLDAPVSIEDGETYQLLIATDGGEYVTADVDAEAGEAVTELPLVAALPANIRAGAVFAMSATDMEPRLFRVVSNTPEKHLFNIVALEDDAEKYNRVELGINVADDAPYVLPPSALPDAPTGVAVQLYIKPDPGSKSKLRLLVSWSPPGNPLVTKYVIRMKEPNGPWREVGSTAETSLELTPAREDTGIYQVRVFAVTVLGELSQPGQAQTENTNSWPRPATPTGWQGMPGHDSITLWGNAHPDPDFKAFVIYGATADDPTLLRLDEVTTTRYVRRVPTSSEITRYAVTALNYNGDESFATGFIAVVPSPPTMDDFDPSVFETIEASANAAAVATVEEFRDTTFADAEARLTALSDDAVDMAQRLAQSEDELERLAEDATAALLKQGLAETRMYDAGIRVDEDTGEVFIEGIARHDDRLITVEQRLQAAEGLLTLKATLVEVNQAIASAQLTPTELAALDDVWTQINEVEQTIDAINATLTQKASVATTDGLSQQLTQAQTQLDALSGEVETLVTNTEFTALQTALTGIQETLSVLDVPGITRTVYDIQLQGDQVEVLAEQAMQGLLDGYNADQAGQQRLAVARDELTADITEANEAIAQAKLELGAGIDGAVALVQQESTARADGETATAQQISTLTATVGDQGTAITQTAEAVAGLGGTVQYLINTNGHIAGWALTNQVENGDPFAAFTFLADKFQISSVDGSSSPFIVYTQPTNVNGTVVPAGVYLKDAFIRNGIFDSAKIADVIQSANYQQGVSGWRILKSGQAEFNDVVISRDQVIDTGTLWIGNVPGAGGALAHVGTWYAETNTATGAWSANPSSFYVSVGRYGSEGTIWSNPGSYGTANIQWGWSGEVVPITRWSGAQRLWIKIMFHARNVHNGTGFRVEWKLKRIT